VPDEIVQGRGHVVVVLLGACSTVAVAVVLQQKPGHREFKHQDCQSVVVVADRPSYTIFNQWYAVTWATRQLDNSQLGT